MRKFLVCCFGIACIISAANSVFELSATFAPADAGVGFLAGESEAIERVRNHFAAPVLVTSGMLGLAGIWIAISGWTQIRKTSS